MSRRPTTDIVGDMTWDVVARRLQAGAFAILPIGSGAKQHARHMPMRTDAVQAEWLAARLAERVPALIWPTVTYGHYPAFVGYAGSCSLSASAFETLVAEIVASLLGFGARGVLVIDTGLSTIAPIGRAVAALAETRRVLHLKVYSGRLFHDAARRLATEVRIGHADVIETSCLLAIAPDLVAMDRIEPGLLEMAEPGPLQNIDPTAANFSASGGIGDPTSASDDKGRALLAAMVEDMVAAVDRHF